MNDSNEIKAMMGVRETWDEDYKKAIAKSPERSDNFFTSTGVPVKPLYTPADLNDSDFMSDIGFPGQYPFTRGVYASGYRTQPWNTQQVSGYALADDSNKRLKKLRDDGQGGVAGKDTINAIFDLPTHYGYDSDSPEAASEVGRLGVAIDSMADMEMLFDGFPPDNTFTSFITTCSSIPLLSMYIAHAEKAGVKPSSLMGVMINDPFSSFIGNKLFIYPPRPSMKLVSDFYSYCTKNLPHWNLNGISGYHFREAGGNAVHEMGFAIANAMAHIEAGLRTGLDVDEFVPRFSFFFTVDNNFFEEVAKLRAARRLWARLLKEKYGSKNPRAQMMRFHLQTGGSTLTAQQPDNNIVRITIQAMAAVMAGAQGIHTNAKDEALAIPTDESVKLALRTQQIIACESGITDTVDPLGGSYYLETLTNELESQFESQIEKISEFGDNMLDAVINALDDGYFHTELANSAYKQHKEMMSGSKPVVGVNKYVEEEEPNVDLFELIDATVTRDRQAERLAKIRAERNNTSLNRSLDALARAIENEENVFPHVLAAARDYGTLGEITKVMTDAYGRYTDPSII